jgi:putative oligomerization/nucleic acid binding protein
MTIKVWQLAVAVALLAVGGSGSIFIGASATAALLFTLVVLGTTIWLGFDANKRDVGRASRVTWVLGALLFWVVVFPIYLIRRRRVPFKGDNSSSPPETSTPLPITPGPRPVESENSRVSPAFWLAALCAGGMAIGALGPWARGPLGTTVGGLDGSNDGWFLLAAAAIAGLCLWLHHRSAGTGSLVLILLFGLIGGAVTLYDRQSVNSVTSDSFDVVQVGWGLNLGLAASVGLVICALALFRRPRSRPSLAANAHEQKVGPITHQADLSVENGVLSPTSVSVAKREQPLPVVKEEQATISKSPERLAISGVTTELERLASLRSSGALDDEEFRAAKARLLERPLIPALTTPDAGRRDIGAAKLAGAAAAGAAGAYLIGGLDAARAAGSTLPESGEISYHEVITSQDGTALEMEGTVTETVSGDTMHITNEGTMNIDGETYSFDDSYDIQVEDTGTDGDGLLGWLSDLFG